MPISQKQIRPSANPIDASQGGKRRQCVRKQGFPEDFHENAD